MTWVIGRAGPFGYAVGISDIRVTLNNGKEYDCLQKIYNIGPQMALGFAGSVKMGFEIVNELGYALHSSEENVAWNPRVIAENLHIGTRKIFESFPNNIKELGCQLILLAAHPTENEGAAPWARCFVYRFTSPYFKPLLARPAEIVSIGSGSKVDQYVNALRRLENDFDTLKLESMFQRGAAYGLVTSITAELRKLPVRGISDHVHICIVERDGISIGQNNTKVPEYPEESFTMPPVARSMKELKSFLSDVSNSSIEQAIC